MRSSRSETSEAFRVCAAAAGLTVWAAMGVGCQRPVGDRVEIAVTREFTELDSKVRPAASLEDQFGWILPKPQQQGENPFEWSTPDGWEEVASTGPLRAINFRFGDEGEGECYFGVMQGDGGGLKSNINRWQKQMGTDPGDDDAIAALPKRLLFGGEATYLDLSGDFAGMGATEAKKDYRMLGMIQSSPAFTFFVKLTGPAALVEDNTEAFDEFCRSLRISGRNR